MWVLSRLLLFSFLSTLSIALVLCFATQITAMYNALKQLCCLCVDRRKRGKTSSTVADSSSDPDLKSSSDPGQGSTSKPPDATLEGSGPAFAPPLGGVHRSSVTG